MKLKFGEDEYFVKRWRFEEWVEPIYALGQVEPIRYHRRGEVTIELFSNEKMPRPSGEIIELEGRRVQIHYAEFNYHVIMEMKGDPCEITLRGHILYPKD